MHPLSIVCSAAVVVLCCLSGVHSNETANKINLQEIVDRMTDEQKQTIYQLLLSAGSNQGRQDNTHWCCNIDPGVEATSQTRQTVYYVQRHARNKCGYSSCGVFGWSSCTRWCDNYWSEMNYGVETYLVYQARLCPPANLVCCAGYITVINHCFTYEEIMNNKDILEILVAMGIPISPTMG